MNRPLLLLAATTLATTIVSAQTTIVDDGSFTLVVNGERVGREDFSIRHVPTAAGAYETLTRGVIVSGAHRTTVDLSADSLGHPVRFQSKMADDGRSGDTYRAEVLGRRFSARVVRGNGESARELLIPPGTLLVEDGVLYPLQFVVARGGGSVSAVVPARNRVVTLSVQDAGADRVSIALQTIDARKFIVRDTADESTREVWVDGAGRVLKVAIPALHLVALRDDAPRSAAR